MATKLPKVPERQKPGMPGGQSEVRDATKEIQKICDQVSFNLPTFFKTSTHTTHLNAFTSYFIYTGEGPSGSKDEEEICEIHSS